MKQNIFGELPSYIPAELYVTLQQSPGVRIEQIVSHGHSSPEEFWYDQNENEWVVLLRGAARLQFEEECVDLRPGDYVNIPAHHKHRVAWTTRDEPTIWLAVFYV